MEIAQFALGESSQILNRLDACTCQCPESGLGKLGESIVHYTFDGSGPSLHRGKSTTFVLAGKE
jgi:hypothetical protein